MTGPEFATAHGNDSTDWTPADFEAEMNLAEIDALPAPAKAWLDMAASLQRTADQIRAARSPQPAA